MVYVLAETRVADLTTLCDSGWEGVGQKDENTRLQGKLQLQTGQCSNFERSQGNKNAGDNSALTSLKYRKTRGWQEPALALVRLQFSFTQERLGRTACRSHR